MGDAAEPQGEPGSPEPAAAAKPETPPEKPAVPGPDTPPAPEVEAAMAEDTYAVMKVAIGGLTPGQVVRGSWGDVNDMLLADMARAATPAEVERAGKFIFTLPEA